MWCHLNIVILLAIIRMAYPNVISTAQGKLRGVIHETHVSYTGVPYATVANMSGRFKGAGLAPFWQGIRYSHDAQCAFITNIEDCLQLDVHVPLTTSSQWPVLVWVTGGTGQYHPSKLVQQGIIVVVVYHRIGPLGFLCLGDEKIPGNAGVKDVVLALRWVRDNIVAFKGNPANVVVGGQSFGAAMVEALTLSPMAEDLYHGVILQSGSILAPWAFNYDAKERAISMGNMLSGSDDISNVILNATVKELMAKSNKLNLPYYPFGMCVENPLKNQERLLIEPPFDRLSSKKVGRVPMIIGYNSNEGYVFASIIKETKVLKKISRGISFLLPEELQFLNERELKQVARQVEDIYFKNNNSMAAVLEYHRDAYFLSHIHNSARLHALASHIPIYYYQFSHSGDIGVREEPGLKKIGAAHSDELAYLFPNGRDLDGDDVNVQSHLIELWTNFVKYLNPNPRQGESTHWEAMGPDNPRLLDIGTRPRMTEFPHAKAARMWEDVYQKFYYSRHRFTT